MSTKKKIGIVTFYNTLDNYGQVLQYLATQEYLSERGHEVCLYQTLGHKKISFFRIKRKIKKILKNLLNLNNRTSIESTPLLGEMDVAIVKREEIKNQIFRKWAEITQKGELEHPRYFADFRRRYFHVLKCYYEDLRGFSAFAIGSDQMWSSITEDTLLDFVPFKARRFSIAPSVGHKVFTCEEIHRAAHSLKKFDFITVREQNGLDFCHECGRDDAQLVLDPTFLLRKENYDRFADLQGLDLPKRYIFLYLLGGEIELDVSDIFVWAKTNDLEVVYVASQGREDMFTKCHATVDQWLAILQNAEYVFTNSFHGMALSIIYHKPFLVFPLVGIMENMNVRINNLANQFKLMDRIYHAEISAITKSIDWSCSEKCISENLYTLDSLLHSIQL